MSINPGFTWVEKAVRLHQVSSLKRVEANRYRRRHTRRFMSTTMVAMITVATSSTSKRPESLARLMVLPRPGTETNAALKMEIFGDDAGVPRSAGGGDHIGNQIRKNCRQDQKTPAIPGSETENARDFFQVRRNRHGAGYDIE